MVFCMCARARASLCVVPWEQHASGAGLVSCAVVAGCAPLADAPCPLHVVTRVAPCVAVGRAVPVQGFKNAMLSLSNCTLMLVHRPRFNEEEGSSDDDDIDMTVYEHDDGSEKESVDSDRYV
jgi:hypothetical protein